MSPCAAFPARLPPCVHGFHWRPSDRLVLAKDISCACWVSGAREALVSIRREIETVRVKFRLLSFRMDHFASDGGQGQGQGGDVNYDDDSASGVIVSVETTVSKITGCIARCEAHILDLSGSIREPCVPELLREKSLSFLSCWRTLTLHRASLDAYDLKFKALLSLRGLSVLYEQPGGVLLPGERCTHARSACTFPRCSAVTKVASNFPVY